MRACFFVFFILCVGCSRDETAEKETYEAFEQLVRARRGTPREGEVNFPSPGEYEQKYREQQSYEAATLEPQVHVPLDEVSE